MPDKIATKVTEELAGASIPDLVLGLGMAVAQANEALHKSGSSVIYTIPEAEIELTVALSVSSKTAIGGNIGGSISAFAINASYSNAYGYSAEASSKIRIKLQATPRQEETPAAPAALPAAG